MRRAARTDRNHTEIAKAFEALGCTVRSLAPLGHGIPDLLVGVAARNLLVEVKDGSKSASRRKLTPDQEEFRETWRGSIMYVSSLNDVATIVRAMRLGEILQK